MRIESSATQIILRITHDEARELADDNVWDDADTYAVTMRLGELIRDEIDEIDDEAAREDEDEDQDDSEDDEDFDDDDALDVTDSAPPAN